MHVWAPYGPVRAWEHPYNYMIIVRGPYGSRWWPWVHIRVLGPVRLPMCLLRGKKDVHAQLSDTGCRTITHGSLEFWPLRSSMWPRHNPPLSWLWSSLRQCWSRYVRYCDKETLNSNKQTLRQCTVKPRSHLLRFKLYQQQIWHNCTHRVILHYV